VKAFDQFLAKAEICRASGHAQSPAPERRHQPLRTIPDGCPVTSPEGDAPFAMDAQLMEALGDILADALLADLETEMEEEHALAVASAESPTGSGSRTEDLVAVSSLAPDPAQRGNPSDPIVVRA
jgi:hypothetical protein